MMKKKMVKLIFYYAFHQVFVLEQSGIQELPKRRIRKSDENGATKDLPNAEKIAKSRESTVEPRAYQLREKRTPKNTYSGRPIRNTPAFTRQKITTNEFRRKLREKRKTRYSSSSTESSDEETNAAKRDAKDEAKFQRRQMRSMHQSRQNLMPVNMSGK